MQFCPVVAEQEAPCALQMHLLHPNARRKCSKPFSAIVSVQRDRHPCVIVQHETRPAECQLDDAYEIVRETGMDDIVKLRLLPGVLRAAIEAAA